MNVLLLIPPFKENVVRDVLYGCWCKGKRIGGATVPPLVLLSVATVLKNDNHNVRILDAPSEDKTLDDIKNIVRDYDTLLLLTSTMTFTEDVNILKTIKEANKDIKTIIFGSHPTFMPEFSIKEGIDIIVRKEPEFIIRDLLRNIKDDKWKKTKGIGYKENNKLIINEDYPLITNLDDLPIPDRSLLPKDVTYFNPIIKKLPYTTSETSRGCPGKCNFCTAPAMYGNLIRCWSSKKVLEEIDYLVKFGFKEIYYRDETFTTFKKRNLEILNSITQNKIDITWACNVRVNTVDKETLELMKKAGCHLIKIGVESGVQHILDRSNKGIKLEDTEKLFKWAKEAGIDTHAHLMLGMPGETKETIKQTLKFIKKINPYTIDIGICTPYPGSVLFEEIAKEHPEIKDGTAVNLENLHTEGLYNEFYTSLTREEIEKNLSKLYKSFYLNPRHIVYNLSRIRSINDIKKIANATYNLLKFFLKRK